MMPQSHLDQVVQRVVLLVQCGLSSFHRVPLVLRVGQRRRLDLRRAAAHRAASPRPAQLPARALRRRRAIGGGGGDRWSGRSRLNGTMETVTSSFWILIP